MAALNAKTGGPGTRRGGGQDPMSSAPLPKHVAIELTNRCNYRCFFCNRGSESPEGTGAKQVYGILPLEKFYELAPLMKAAEVLDITGWGEVLTYPRLREALDFINQTVSRPSLFLTTNGSLLTEETARLLSPTLHQLVLSLNAASKVTYERDMKPGKWHQVLTNIYRARKYIPGDRMVFSFVMHRDNMAELPDFVKLAHEFEVSRVRVLPILITKRENLPFCLWFHKEKANALIEAAQALGRELGLVVESRRFFQPVEEMLNRQQCRAPFEQVYIGVHGEVAPCCFSGTQTMGNIFAAGGFEAVWNGRKYQALRRKRFFPECRVCMPANNLDRLETHIPRYVQEEIYPLLPRFVVLLIGDRPTLWLQEALESLRAQTYPLWSAWVVPGALAAPEAEELVARYQRLDSRVKGLAASRLDLADLPEAQEILVAFLSPGWIMAPQRLESHLKAWLNLDRRIGAVAEAAGSGAALTEPLNLLTVRLAALRRLLGARPLWPPGGDLVQGLRDQGYQLHLLPRSLTWHLGHRWRHLGERLFHLGDYCGAREAFEQALDLDPCDPVSQEYLAQLGGKPLTAQAP